MKNDRSRKATSHMAVMSIAVLFRGNLTFGIVKCYLVLDANSGQIP
jgi:hypothetical protein